MSTFFIPHQLPSFISLFIYVGNAAVMSFLTPCGLERGIEQISLYFLVNNLAVIVSRLTVGRVITFIPKRTCILFSIILCGVGTGLIAVAYNLALMMLSAVLVGVGMTAVSQLLQVEVLTAVPSERRGLASTTFMLLRDIGNGVGAAIWGAVSAGAGYVLTYALAGGIHIGGMLISWTVLEKAQIKHKKGQWRYTHRILLSPSHLERQKNNRYNGMERRKKDGKQKRDRAAAIR